jgi:hypothetical protein
MTETGARQVAERVPIKRSLLDQAVAEPLHLVFGEIKLLAYFFQGHAARPQHEDRLSRPHLEGQILQSRQQPGGRGEGQPGDGDAWRAAGRVTPS